MAFKQKDSREHRRFTRLITKLEEQLSTPGDTTDADAARARATDRLTELLTAQMTLQNAREERADREQERALKLKLATIKAAGDADPSNDLITALAAQARGAQ